MQVVSMVLPVAIFALLARYPVRDVLSLAPPKPMISAPAGLMLGIGLALIAIFYQIVQYKLTGMQPSDQSQQVAELINQNLKTSLTLSVLAFGVVPGFCEEIVFRGVVLSALRRKSNIHVAVWVTAVLFAAVHMDMAGMITRTLLGAVLGYVVVISGSIFPAMLLHAAYNGTQVVLMAVLNGESGATTQPAIPDDVLNPLAPRWLIQLAIGIVLALVSGAMFWSAARRAALSPAQARSTTAP
jgi:membrane protease YdiL (CAAX protease family)